jgi:hypothetical protein
VASPTGQILESLFQGSKPLSKTDPEFVKKHYIPYVINDCIGKHFDSLQLAAYMNTLANIPKLAQYNFYFYTLRKYKRPFIAKNDKTEQKPVGHVLAVMKYYGYSEPRAIEALELLTKSQIKVIVDATTIGRFEKL